MKVKGNLNVTRLDLEALKLIKQCEFIGVDKDGTPALESNSQISIGRMKRLIEQDLIVSNRDSLLPELNQPQSYALTRRGMEAVT